MTEQAVELIGRGDPESICRGAEILERTGGEEAIRALLPLLGSRSERVADCVRSALDRMDVPPLLLAWWRGADPGLRADALRYAVRLSHAGLMELYREAARDDDPWSRRSAAIGLKRQRPTPELFAMLARLIADPDRDVRWWGIDALDAIGGPTASELLRKRGAVETDPDLKVFIERALRSR